MEIKATIKTEILPYKFSGFVKRYIKAKKLDRESEINLRFDTDSDNTDKFTIYAYDNIQCHMVFINYSKFPYLHIGVKDNGDKEKTEHTATVLTEIAKAYVEYAELSDCEIDCVIVVRKLIE